jgi:N-acetylglucosamine malate deacetylase 1
MIELAKRMTVIAPHPDDETLGAGGTIARFADQGVDISVLIVSGHLPPLYKQGEFETTRREADAALRSLGARNWKFLQIPATKVHELPVAELNDKISGYLRETNPEVVLVPFPDRHIDHRSVFDAAMVSCRPSHSKAPRVVLAYETLSETHWNAPGIEPAFTPDFYVDISNYMDRKKAGLECYVSQLANSPARCIDACTALARFRGSQNGCTYAEAFKLVRAVI